MKTHRSSNQRHERLYFTDEGNKRAAFCKNKMEEEMPRFALLVLTIDDFEDEQENKNTRARTEREESLLKTFLQRKVELSNVEEITLAQLIQ